MKIKALSELEQEIMNVVWDRPSCSVRDVFEKVTKKKELAYTTVATILVRLYEKGLVNKSEKDNIIHYSPKISKTKYSNSVAGSFFNKFFQTFGDLGIAAFADSIEELPAEKKKYFLDLLEKKNESK